MSRIIKDNIYANLAVITKALSSPKRIEILELLSQSEKTVENIAEQTALGIKNASAQLKELKSARLLGSRKVGKHVYYFIISKSVSQFLISLRDFAEERSIELQEIIKENFSNLDKLDSISKKSLISKAKKGEVVIIDVRPIDEFMSGHIPYALSVPLSQLKKTMKDFSKNIKVVAYCRGPYCFLAKEAVELLRAKGFKATRLDDSIMDWEAQGFSVTRSA